MRVTSWCRPPAGDHGGRQPHLSHRAAPKPQAVRCAYTVTFRQAGCPPLRLGKQQDRRERSAGGLAPAEAAGAPRRVVAVWVPGPQWRAEVRRRRWRARGVREGRACHQLMGCWGKRAGGAAHLNAVATFAGLTRGARGTCAAVRPGRRECAKAALGGVIKGGGRALARACGGVAWGVVLRRQGRRWGPKGSPSSNVDGARRGQALGRLGPE